MRNLLLLLSLGGLLLTGCKETHKVENGEIPEAFLEQARAYVGTYSGIIEGRTGELVVALEGRRMVLSYHDESGQDLIGPGCQSRIGDLKVVKVKKDDQEQYILKNAKFDFDPNYCRLNVDGRSLDIEIDHSTDTVALKLTILERVEYERDPNCHRYPRPGEPSWPCRDVQRPSYLRGIFFKAPGN